MRKQNKLTANYKHGNIQHSIIHHELHVSIGILACWNMSTLISSWLYKMLTLHAFLCANISITLHLSISENLYHSIHRIPKSDSLSWGIAAHKYVFSNLSFERLRSLLATVTGRVKNLVYAVTIWYLLMHNSNTSCDCGSIVMKALKGGPKWPTTKVVICHMGADYKSCMGYNHNVFIMTTYWRRHDTNPNSFHCHDIKNSIGNETQHRQRHH